MILFFIIVEDTFLKIINYQRDKMNNKSPKKYFKSTVALNTQFIDKNNFINCYKEALKRKLHFCVVECRTQKQILIGNNIEFYERFMMVKNNYSFITIYYVDLISSVYEIEVI
jgi:tRNA uridine 5-carbamoylmethylation protein Kti12